MFSGMFKKQPKALGARTQSQVRVTRLSLLEEEDGDNQWLMFASHPQDDLSAPSEMSGSTDNLSVNNNTTKVRL